MNFTKLPVAVFGARENKGTSRCYLASFKDNRENSNRKKESVSDHTFENVGKFINPIPDGIFPNDTSCEAGDTCDASASGQIGHGPNRTPGSIFSYST